MEICTLEMNYVHVCDAYVLTNLSVSRDSLLARRAAARCARLLPLCDRFDRRSTTVFFTVAGVAIANHLCLAWKFDRPSGGRGERSRLLPRTAEVLGEVETAAYFSCRPRPSVRCNVVGCAPQEVHLKQTDCCGGSVWILWAACK